MENSSKSHAFDIEAVPFTSKSESMADIKEEATEEEMLQKVAQKITHSAPDILTGYNQEDTILPNFSSFKHGIFRDRMCIAMVSEHLIPKDKAERGTRIQFYEPVIATDQLQKNNN